MPAALLLAGACGSAPGIVDMDADPPMDAAADRRPDARLGCESCSGAVTFLLNETEAEAVAAGGYLYDADGEDYAWIGADPELLLLGQPGPPGFGNAVCFAGGRLQFFGPAFTTIAPEHTLELMIQPLGGGEALLWVNEADQAGWEVTFNDTSQAMGFSFCAADCGTPSYAEGDPIWAAGQWVHVAMVRDGDTVRTYLGGQINAEVSGHATNPVTTPMGLLAGPNDLNFQGCLAWVRLLPCACYAGSAIAPPEDENL